MSQQDSSSNPEPDESISSSIPRVQLADILNLNIKGRDCRYISHLEAIPVNHGGTLQIVFKAGVDYNNTEWQVFTSNYWGPDCDICFKLPCPGNNWIAKIAVGSDSRSELLKLVKASAPKGFKYKYHRYGKVHYGDKVTESFIFESYLEDEDKERVPEGPEMIPTLRERLGFQACETSSE